MEYAGMPYCLSLWCTFGDGTMTLTYDAKGKMNNALASGITTSYAINYQGLRVKKANTNETKLFIHDEAGHILGEYDQNGNALQELFWLGDTPVAMSGSMPCLTGVNGCTEQATAYVWTDHLNTPRELTRVNASSQHVSIWKWDSLPFGETGSNANPSNLAVMTFNHRLPGQYKDMETGLNQNWMREYDSQLWRYVQGDPIGLISGTNVYLYVGANPIGKVDPRGLCSITVSGGASNTGTITLNDDKGNSVGAFNYTSGVMGNTDQTAANKGPIPNGIYTLTLSKISQGGLLRSLTGDWGYFRVPLTPAAGNDTKRSGFFIHGGKTPGSAGCVQVEGALAEEKFFWRLTQYCSGTVRVTVGD